jgi:hypothetical protein
VLLASVGVPASLRAQASVDSARPPVPAVDSSPTGTLKPRKLTKPRGPASDPAPGRVVPPPPPPTTAAPESVTVVPGPEYHAAPVRRLFAGSRYRRVWTTPIRVQVMDLARYAGGLTPLYHGGGNQTVSLHMRGADGVEYVLRSVDKHPNIPGELKQTVVEDVVRDENSAGLPSAAVVAAALLSATGVRHVEPSLFVVPDDVRLGPFRKEFAGMLAEVEARPRTADGEETFAGASKVENTDKLMTELERSASTRVDSRGYLTARLMDMYMGDWDRDESQWRWARVGEKSDRVWEPIPLDRDWAFARYNGLLNGVLSQDLPQLVVFSDRYPDIVRLMFEEWHLDRRLLQGLERPVFDSTAAWLAHQLTDSVIDGAIARMPPGEREQIGPFLASALRRRRDDLPVLAESYYRRMATNADVNTTAQPTVVDIDRRPDTIAIRFHGRDNNPEDPYFERRFARSETREIRLYVNGGPDSITIRGSGDDVRLRVIAASDNDVVVDSSSAESTNTTVYDGGHPVQIINAHAITTDDRTWTQPTPPKDPLAGGNAPLVLDDGSRCVTLPWFGGSSDEGFAAGATITCDAFGFRREPSALHQTLRVAYGALTGGGLVSYQAQLRPTGSTNLWELRVRAATTEYTRFFGLGDGTTLADPSNYYQAHQQFYEVTPGFVIGLAPQATLTLGPDLRYWETGRITGTFLDVSRPYGLGPFGTIAGRVQLRVDTRDAAAVPQSGVFLDVTGRGVPDVWNATQAYGRVSGAVTKYTTARSLPLEPTLVLRAGGTKVWGLAPYQDLAHIGGQTAFEQFSVRGYYPDRFAGDAAAFGTAQLRLTLAHPKLVVPADFGVVGLNDVGRVFVPGEEASVWHNGTGGGVWASWLDRTLGAGLLAVHGSDGTRIYFGAGTGL